MFISLSGFLVQIIFFMKFCLYSLFEDEISWLLCLVKVFTSSSVLHSGCLECLCTCNVLCTGIVGSTGCTSNQNRSYIGPHVNTWILQYNETVQEISRKLSFNHEWHTKDLRVTH